jgi:hypothetical protein
MEQCVNVKFGARIGKSATEMCGLLKKFYGDECLSCTEVFKWFKVGWEEINDDQRPGYPSTSKTDVNIEKVNETVSQN